MLDQHDEHHALMSSHLVCLLAQPVVTRSDAFDKSIGVKPLLSSVPKPPKYQTNKRSIYSEGVQRPRMAG